MLSKDRQQTISDQFGSKQVATKRSLIDLQFNSVSGLNDENNSFVENVAGGTSVFNTNQGSVVQTVSANGDSSRVESGNCITYQSANIYWFYGTACLAVDGGADATNIVYDFGLQRTDCGIFFRFASGVFQVVIRYLNDSGSITENVVSQSAFNLDKLDGNGYSKITFQSTDQQIFAISMQFLFSGQVIFYLIKGGQLFPIHQFTHSTESVRPYIQSANMPIRSYLYTTGAIIGAYPVRMTCSSVQIFGELQKIPRLFESAVYSTKAGLASAATHPLIIIRAKNDTFREAFLSSVTCTTTQAKVVNLRVSIIRNDVDASFTNLSWVDVNTNRSSLQYSIAATQTYAGSKAQICEQHVFSGSNSYSLSDTAHANLTIGCFHTTGRYDYIMIEVVNLDAGAQDVFATANLHEFT